MEFTISQENLQKLVDYLGTKPWMEVNHLFQILTKLQVVNKDSKNSEGKNG